MRILKTLLVVFVLAWGILALAVRATTPLLADYRDELAAIATEQLGAPVDIGSLKARWYGLGPLLELRDVTIGNAPETVEARRVALDLDLTDLLRGSLVNALRITADGLQVTVVREPSGQFHLEGLGTAGRDKAATDVTPPLPRHVRLINTRVIWIDHLHRRTPLAIDNVNVLLDHDGDNVSLRANLESAAGRAELSARLRGLPGGTDWDGDSYLRVEALDLARLLADYVPVHYGLETALLDAQVWTRWKDALPSRSQGRLALRDIDMQPTGGAPLTLSLLAANFSAKRTTESLSLGLDGLELASRERRWPLSRLALSIESPVAGPRQIRLAADYLHLHDVAALLNVRPPSDRVREALAAMQPSGEIRNVRAVARTGDSGATWRAQARLDAVSVDPWDQIPGVERLSGEFLGGDQHSALTLDSNDVTLRFSDLFRDPLVLPRVAGRVDFVQLGDGWQLRSDRLEVDAEHLATLTRIDLLQNDGEPLFIDLQTDFRDGDAAFASRYYPVGIMGKSLVRWLDSAITSGRVVSGSALLYGKLDDFAWETTRTGSFQVVFDTEDVHLDYREGWPALTGLDAHVRFHGKQLDIAATDGLVYDSRIKKVSARIASLDPLAPIRIRGEVAGPLQNTLRVLGEPALRNRFGRFAEILRGVGDSDLALDFAVPLRKQGNVELNGHLTFAGNQLSLPDWDFAMRDINGQLNFDLDGLKAKDIRASAFGAPVRIDVSTATNGSTRVRTRGRFKPSEIAARIEGVPLDAVSGKAAFIVDVDVPPSRAADKPALLAVRSDLDGISVDLPPPLGKPPRLKRDLDVRIPLGDPAGNGSARYGKRLAADFSPDGQRIGIMLGGGAATTATKRGIAIDGRLDNLDIDAWQAALASLPDKGTDKLPPLHVDLFVGRARSGEVHIDNLRIKAHSDDRSWQGSLSADMLAGRFNVPRDSGRAPVQIDLDRLSIELPPDTDEAPGPPPDAERGPDPVGLPGLALNVAALRVEDAELGRLQLLAAPTPTGLEISRLALQDGSVTLDATGYWSRADGAYRTQIGGKANTPDLGKLLVDLGYSRQLEDAAADGSFVLGWPGNPLQAHRATLEGRFDAKVGKGRLVELDPGVTRVFGLLNLNALTRRLRLDFSDFYKKGYSFDEISGGFAFANGTATTDKFSMTGPTGRIDVTGSTDLINETLDQRVAVTPNLDATLPIAGTIAGGPVAGIAVFVAQKVMTKQVDALNRFDYSLTGPWAQPIVKQLDSGGTFSKLLKPFSGGDQVSTEGDKADDQAPAVPTTGTPVGQTDGPPPANPTPDAETTPHLAESDTAPAPLDAPQDTKSQGEKRSGPLRSLFGILKSGEPQDLDQLGE